MKKLIALIGLAFAAGVHAADTNTYNTSDATNFSGSVISATAQFKAAVGSAGTPSYSFTTYPTTGMYSGAANTIDFSTAGTQRLTIGATGILNVPNLTASQAVFTDASKNLVSNAITGTGNVVMSASPTLTGAITAAAATFSGALTLNGSASVASQVQMTPLGGISTVWSAASGGTFQLDILAGYAYLINVASSTDYTTANSKMRTYMVWGLNKSVGNDPMVLTIGSVGAPSFTYAFSDRGGGNAYMTFTCTSGRCGANVLQMGSTSLP